MKAATESWKERFSIKLKTSYYYFRDRLRKSYGNLDVLEAVCIFVGSIVVATFTELANAVIGITVHVCRSTCRMTVENCKHFLKVVVSISKNYVKLLKSTFEIIGQCAKNIWKTTMDTIHRQQAEIRKAWKYVREMFHDIDWAIFIAIAQKHAFAILSLMFLLLILLVSIILVSFYVGLYHSEVKEFNYIIKMCRQITELF